MVYMVLNDKNVINLYIFLFSMKYFIFQENWSLFQIMLLQIFGFHEIINIGYVVYRSYDLPWFRTLSWYFLFASNYFFYGESLIDHFGVLLHRTVSIQPSILRLCLLRASPFSVEFQLHCILYLYM